LTEFHNKMSFITNKLTTFLFSNAKNLSANCNTLRTKTTKWVDHRMARDVNRRKMACEMAPMRLRIVSLKRNDVLPIEIREEAAAEIHTYPKNSTLFRVNKRCVVTSRGHGVVPRWRISRIVFRHLADYNKLAGSRA